MDKVRGIRACPICPLCNGRKFRIVARYDDGSVMLECLRCSNRILV
ncbi:MULTISPECIES: hypothetical protein [Candidatus Nitrosocaldus]|jgi:hypothetical protein|uniref:Uncharacterized protein n=1 Tax=Candidatus Nitrosocaldus cavascurensis TaxID=2058097 RepID=A0A2K5AQ95_9ARCH|nr:MULTISPECIES: hypothetical protein [Candidatus Nitrosocaldus]SPC33823.1 conserved protein of unknown function [Candidatus Nitrosocaldus cavascurensis]